MKHYLIALVISVAAIFAPIEGMLGTVAALIASDLVLGILAARKRKESITSTGLKRTISKLFIYEIALMLGFLAEHYLSSALPICKLIGGMISMTEMLSIMENLNEVSSNNLLKGIVDKLQSTSSNNEKKD